MYLILALLGCDNASAPLPESWQIDRLRILAVAAEPAEPRPGDTVTLSSLVVSPTGPVAMTVYFACMPENADDYGCSVDPTALDDLLSTDPSQLTPEEQAALFVQLQAAGLVGVEPYFPPSWVVPADALDGLTEAEQLEGVNAFVSLTSIPEGDDVQQGDLELAYKRVPVSTAATPNHNPAIATLTVDGIAIAPGATVEVDRGQGYVIGVTLADDAVEAYTYVDDAGVGEDRTEEPYLLWYTEQGGFDSTATLYPDLDVTYVVPEEPEGETGNLWVVVRDRRGGMSWAGLALRYR